MPSRRDILTAAGAISTAAFFRPMTSLFAAAAQPATPVDFKVPKGACDCHVHVFDPQRFPFFSGRTYTPEPATVAELKEMHRKLRIDRVVIVQASVYGGDNAVTLDALKQLGSNARGVAVIDEHTPNTALDEMQQGGVRGVRINMGGASEGELPLVRRRMKATLDRIGGRNWHLQVYLPLAVAAGLMEDVMAAPVPIVFDHFAGVLAAGGVDQPGFNKVLKMVQAGKAYVKVSAAYRASKLVDYADAAPLAKALIAANPQRVLWGSDWPHPDTSSGRKATEISPLLQRDDGRLLNLLAAWAPEAAMRKTILVDNPAMLYGFR
jgi:predicted TIM-barrel fold metal-dependent hydrolase